MGRLREDLLVLPGKRLLETGLGRTGADLLLRAINVAVWLGFAGTYLWATCRPLSYLKLWHNAPKGLTVGFLVGPAFVGKDLVRVTLLEGPTPDFAGLSPVTFSSPFVEGVVFRGLVLQRAGEYMGFWKANALSAGLFVGVRVPGWIFSGVPLPGIVSSAAFVLVLALVLGYLPKRTGARGPARCATR